METPPRDQREVANQPWRDDEQDARESLRNAKLFCWALRILAGVQRFWKGIPFCVCQKPLKRKPRIVLISVSSGHNDSLLTIWGIRDPGTYKRAMKMQRFFFWTSRPVHAAMCCKNKPQTTVLRHDCYATSSLTPPSPRRRFQILSGYPA